MACRYVTILFKSIQYLLITREVSYNMITVVQIANVACATTLNKCGRAKDRKQAATRQGIAATQYELKLIKFFCLFKDFKRLW